MAPPAFNPRNPTMANPPGPSRGILSWLRETVGGWLGPRLADRAEAYRYVRDEKAASQPRGVILPQFLPYYDNQTGETAEMRRMYRRMLASPEVKGAMLGKVFGVASLDLKIQPANKKDERHREVAEFVRYNLEERIKGCFPALAWSVLIAGLTDGHSVSEKVIRPESKGRFAGKWVLADLKPKDVDNDVVLLTDEFRNTVGVMGLRYNAGQVFSPSDFLIYTHQPLYGNPTGTSDLRAVYGRWWMLDTVLKIRAMGLDKRALPLLMGTYNDPAKLPSLEAALALARSQSWIAVPEGAKVEAVNIAGQADDMFRSAVQDLKHDIFLGIMGAVLQSLEGTVEDARGNSQVHKSTSDLFRWYLSASLEALLNDRECGLIKDIVDLNYVVDEYPRATLSAVDVNELQAELAIDTGLHAIGVPLNLEETYERYGRTPPAPGDAANTLPGQQGSQPDGSQSLPFDDINLLTAQPKKMAGSEVPATTTFRGFREGWRRYLAG